MDDEALLDPHDRDLIRRQLPAGASEAMVDEWMRVEPRMLVVNDARMLSKCGLSPRDVQGLYNRLGNDAVWVRRLLEAGELASVNARWVHWWAAAGVFTVSQATPAPGRRSRHRVGKDRFTGWVSAARRYIVACGGNQEAAALAAAAGLSVEEARDQHAAGALDLEKLRFLAALRLDAPLIDPGTAGGW